MNWEPPPGGIEQNIALFLEDDHSAGHDEHVGSWRFAHRIGSRVVAACGELGGHVQALDEDSLGPDVFDGSGNRLALEGVGENPTGSMAAVVFELSTRESCAADVVAAREECLGVILGAVEESGLEGATLAAPGFLPRFGRARPFRLAFDVNVSARPGLTSPEARAQVSTAMVAMMPLLAPGGIGLSGRFCVSPAASANSTRAFFGPPPAYLAESRSLNVWGASPSVEYRLHIPLEACFRRRTGALLAFAAAQAAAAMAVEGCLEGLALANVARAARRFSEDPYAARCRLTGGKLVTLGELSEGVLSRFEAFLAGNRPPEELEPALPLLREGMRKVSAGIPADDEDELLQSFDYFRKRWIFREVMERRFGLHAERATDLFRALRMFSVPPDRLMEMSPLEVSRAVGAMKGEHAARLRTFMQDGRIAASDLPPAAKAYKTWEAVELRLHELWPEPGPLEAEDAAAHLLMSPGESQGPCGRARVRSRHISYLTSTGNEHNARADWANMYYAVDPPPEDCCARICVQPFSEGPRGSSPGPISLVRADPKEVMMRMTSESLRDGMVEALCWAIHETFAREQLTDVEEAYASWLLDRREQPSVGGRHQDHPGAQDWLDEEDSSECGNGPECSVPLCDPYLPSEDQMTLFDPGEYVQYSDTVPGPYGTIQFALFDREEYSQALTVITVKTIGMCGLADAPECD